MGLEEWMLWIVTETIKYLLITFGVFGFEFRDAKRKYLCSLYLFVGIPVLIYFDINTLLYRTMWGIIIIFVLFKGKIEKKNTGIYFGIYYGINNRFVFLEYLH